MVKVNKGLAGIAALGLAGCMETAGLAGGGAPAAIGGGGGGSVGDGAFVRDENGCLYEMIAGARVAIVGPDGKHDCGRVS